MQSRLDGGLPAKLSQGPRTGYDLSRMGAGASRGPNGKKKLEAAPWSNTFPAPGATLDLDFANNRGWVRGLGQGGVMDGITFTRASNGTFVGPDGLLAGSGGNAGALGVNLLTFPQDFENAAWTKTNAAVSTNVAVAPDGTYTADNIVPNTTNGIHLVAQNGGLTTGQAAIATVYVKKGGYRYFVLYTAYGAGGNNIISVFDLDTVSVVSASGSGASPVGAISDAGDGWFRVSLSFVSQFTGARAVAFGPLSDSTFTTYSGDGTSGIFIWGAQLELGSTATPYYPTNIGVPRFDWAGTGVVARKNRFAFTEAFNTGTWIRIAASVVANDAIAPDGTQTADKLIANNGTAAGTKILEQSSFGAGVYTASVYAKAAGFSSFRISGGPAFGELTFNLSTGTVVSGGGMTATITDIDDGWYRCGITWSALDARLEIRTDQIGDGVSGIYLWGAQLELGSTATEYTPVAQPTTNTPLRPTETCNGLLIEEARTNRLLWCRDATQANWTKTDITAAKDATGIDGVANAASSLTATADGGTCIQTITLASGSRTGSVYLKRITGTGAVQVSLDGSTWSTVDLSADEWRRIALSGTVTNPVVGIRLAVSGDAVAMDFGQVEDGAFATTPVLTTTATATRSADFATMPTAQQPTWFDPGYGTIYAAGAIRPTADGLPLVGLGVGTGSLYRVGSNPTTVLSWWSGSALLTTANSAVWADGVRVAGSFNSSGRSLCLNGGPVAETASTLPYTGIFNIGRNANNVLFANGTIKQITCFNRRFANAALQALTGPAT
jgi:hypothetical protein